MKKIYKYELDRDCVNREQIVNMPVNAKVISFGEQGEILFFWAEVPFGGIVDHVNTNREFCLSFTGFELPERAKDFHGTVQIGYLVYHLYECY